MAAYRIPASCPTLARLLAPVLLAALASGCASFKSTQRLDVGPFAENTVGMIGEVQRATKPVVWTYLKKYETLPSIQDVRDAYAPARTLMRGVALYSTQIVSIYESDLSESRKSQELARYLDEAIRERLKSNRRADMFLTQGRLDSAVTKARAASTFMAALSAAQPVVSAALSFGNSVYDSLDMKIDQAAGDVDRRIEMEFAPLKRQLAEVSDLELRATARYTWLSRYRLGDAAALDSLRAHDPEAADAMPAGKRPAAATLEATEKRILVPARDHEHTARAPRAAVRGIPRRADGARRDPHPGPRGDATGTHHAHPVGALAPQPGRRRQGAGRDQPDGNGAVRGGQGDRHRASLSECEGDARASARASPGSLPPVEVARQDQL
jgi:hypothetical protein